MNIDPALYSRYNGAQKLWDGQLLASTPFLRTDYGRIVDVGCGTGEVSNMVRRKFPNAQQMVAFDLTAEIVAYASERNPGPAIHYCQADIADRGTFSADWLASFDLLTSFFVLHWVRDQPAAIRNVASLLKPDGEFLLLIAVYATSGNLGGIAPTLIKSKKWKEYFINFDDYVWHPEFLQGTEPAAAYRNVCEAAGLSVLSCRVVPLSYTCPDADYCKGLLESSQPWIRTLPEHLQAEFVNDLFATAQHVRKSPEGQPILNIHSIAVHGMKKK